MNNGTARDDATSEAVAQVEVFDVEVFDEDGALSRAFLLQRGFCCENGCKNCPYGFRKPPQTAPHT